ncbi:hypothetical protein CDAR_235511 [Caerostris darwini]|uniref:DNA-directed DNA polymerase n=1 Tax=Caerostris darwini TaxID=1538125 RepID=A0AAV4NDC5_9ARAC|nr:hypothetical protein CDAR_235511 [Caerostris darwini]
MEFSYYIKYENEYFKAPVYYHGDDAVNKFISMLQEDTIKIEAFIKEKEENIDKLPKNLRSTKNLKSVFKETAKHFPEDKLDLITRKGVYPYDYMDCEEKYKETELPPKEAFYNRLNECDISDEDYKHAQNVWKSFNINNLREYSELYVKTDVLILADIFEKFRDVCLKTYKLDPARYFTAPGLSWNAMLKKTRVKLDLIHDIDMVVMIEKGVRGGML